MEYTEEDVLDMLNSVVDNGSDILLKWNITKSNELLSEIEEVSN
ncbi:MAG: hypothetical protein WC055_09940 [Melioribacteraceae bacterium]